MIDYSKAVFLPANKQVLNLFKGYILNGELLDVSESDVHTKENYYLNTGSPSLFEQILKVLCIILLLPVFLILPIAAIFKKFDAALHGVMGSLDKIFKILFKEKRVLHTKLVLKKEFEGVFEEDVPGFLTHCKNNFVSVYLYSYYPLSEEDQFKVKNLIAAGHIKSCEVIFRLSDLAPLLISEKISKRNSFLVISNSNEKHEASLLGFNPKNGWLRNVELLGKRKSSEEGGEGELEWNSSESFFKLKDKIEYYLKGKSNPFLSNDLILFIEDARDDILNDYILRNLDNFNKRLQAKGFQLIYFPTLQWINSSLQKSILDLIRYRQPLLYSLSDNELDLAVAIILKKITPKEFYEMVVEALELPYFKKPSLLRNISLNDEEVSTFTYKAIEYSTAADLDRFFNWYLEQIKIRKDSQDIYYSLAKPPADYDADWHFSTEGKQLSEELKQKIDSLKDEGKYGALVEAIMYMLETIKDDKPEIIDKVRPLLEKRKLLESRVVLSPIVIDKHYNIFLPAFGNQEVKMHALPKTVYLLFLRYPKGIRFKELYQHKTELLEIYNKVTNKYEKEEIERAIDDLVDMTKPSINQKCARIREAFRTIMDEHIAKHYYIDGMNGEPKSIALSPDLITIQK